MKRQFKWRINDNECKQSLLWQLSYSKKKELLRKSTKNNSSHDKIRIQVNMTRKLHKHRPITPGRYREIE